MESYFFVLGTNHSLSKIDIINLLVKEGIEFETVEASEEILVLHSAQKVEISSLMKELGSAVKIGKIFGCFAEQNFPEEFFRLVPESEFKEFFWPKGNKDVRFGISVYNGGGGFKRLNKIWFLGPKLLRDLKEKLGESGREASYLPAVERRLSSVTVDKNTLLKSGFELVLVVGSKGIWVGKTLAIQPYESYSQRDYGRPLRDTKSGMIPPKLAKMMINLAGKEKEAVFLDPFCGGGTILQELILLGYKNIVGSDKEEKTIENCKVNLEWLFKNYSLKKEDYKLSLLKKDVKNLSEELALRSIDAIVTEPFLGSPQAKYFYPDQIKKEIAKLESLYLEAFRDFAKILKDDGVIVIIFPVFRFKNDFFYLQILEKIFQIGFKRRNFLLKEPLGTNLLRLEITKRGSIVYFRPGQTISREIFILTLTRT